ncbi:cryptochrome/deoxyribodipyrimidine photo-lyase family protein [Bizionia myxarmorum]|uniref:Deoxyribodipyrimidine photo-lyase n=1 Tax=Bizionia myxarmorum TaxID=291186 RepID=A0A5D0R0E4_9FLAO|nr:deoxyribodipyrimidine photo-lyase [Bizionia myxarmorum]TYB74346.1 deoxyribodipyrimidine photo-lyase [Bizionia myxarmorum]
MLTNREPIHIVWFKRDLRLEDHEPLQLALQQKERVLCVFIFEQLLLEDPHYSQRHWDFIKESIRDLNQQLEVYNTKVLTINSDIISACNLISNTFQIKTVYSHQETGILVTFDRDKSFKRYCKNNLITWKESIHNGVVRGLINRETWFENWNTIMAEPLITFSAASSDFLDLETIKTLETQCKVTNLETKKEKPFQPGGTSIGLKYLNSFLKDRHKNYMFHISKPDKSRKSCSRLSPYIAWGNISVRQVYQSTKNAQTSTSHKKQLSAFRSRLRWQAHFIQKFEMEHIMESSSVNKGYHKLKKNISDEYQKAWREGQTGFPLVDASMRCLNETGYVNFRMRAMLVSFFTHILWQPWQDASKHLSQQFLDFEPGIHFPQLQMQAGETGINNLRIYNPIKNSLEHDPDGVFIKFWVPELRALDLPFVHEPYLMTTLDQQFNNFELGVHYPIPIVDLKLKRKRASDVLWNMKKNSTVRSESLRILQKHTLNNRSNLLKNDED